MRVHKMFRVEWNEGAFVVHEYGMPWAGTPLFIRTHITGTDNKQIALHMVLEFFINEAQTDDQLCLGSLTDLVLTDSSFSRKKILENILRY